MDKISIKTGCKINLYLKITGRLQNGYHTLDTLFLPLPEPHDLLEIEILEQGIRVKEENPGKLDFFCSTPGIDPENNTLQKILTLYNEELLKAGADILPPMRLSLHKGVPQGAGLGGGSANAAAFLLFLHDYAKTYSSKLEDEQLATLAAKVGADVPFFLKNVPARASGIGEILHSVPHPLPGWHVLLLCPDIHVNTAGAYAAWDAMQSQYADKKIKEEEPECLTIISAQATKPIADSLNFYNSFEQLVFSAHPELMGLKKSLLANGAAGALMSGSGSSIFGLFAERQMAEQAAESIIKACNLKLNVFIQTLDAGVSPSW